ncbi:MAG: hypothetical protein KC420_21260 [Myxococcales bacterium]|nr:hypothetical protein [Myxococcales bacterium]MCB9568959.1 hypothetical protein [Myxococcales bacterium]MCB9701010.1 hypothetical protein [Myxococcales bacterium]
MPRLHVLLAASLFLACSSQSPAAPAEPPAEKSADAPPADAPPEEGFADPNAKPGEDPPEDCEFRVKGECYKDKDAACKAAGCEPDKCVVLESFPAQIECG